ncbi:MAG: D-glycerate dehydrogenase [Fimbriimonadia bacterium]|jgi:glyoxylate reductase
MSKPNAYVTRWMPEEALDLIRAHANLRQWEPADVPVPRETLLSEAREAEGLLVFLTDRIDPELLDAAPKLRVVSNCAVGFDNIDVPACTARGVAVGNTPGVLTETTADLAWALLMAAARRIGESERVVRGGRWKSWSLMYMVGQDVHGATLGIVGMGRIGTAVARRGLGFGMRILYTDRSANEQAERELGALRVSLDDLLAESDFVSVHLPLSHETRNLFGAEEFRKMKRTAVFVNTARGGVVDQAALARALAAGEIAAAGLDVYVTEPLPMDDPLLGLENVVLTPHIGSASVQTRTGMARIAAQNLVAGLVGEMLPHPVNPEVRRA